MYPLLQSTAITVPFFAHDGNGDAVTGKVTGDWTKRISKASGTFGAMIVTVTEKEGGWYDLVMDSGHTDTLGLLSVYLTASGVKQVNFQWRVGPVPANVTQINGNAAAAASWLTMLDGTGGNVLSLGQLNIVASGNNTAIVATGAGTGAGIAATGGATDAAGLRCTGGGAGAGLRAASGAGLSGDGIEALALSTNGRGIRAAGAGTGPGLLANGINGAEFTGSGAGHGVLATGGGTNGAGMRLVGGATNGAGLSAAGAGSGAGISATGGATGAGILGTGGTNGDGIAATGTGTGHGLNATGGATNGHGLLATGTATGQGIRAVGGATNAAGVTMLGQGSGAGLAATGGATGSGMVATGTGGGHGLSAVGGGAGHGMLATGGGTNGAGLRVVGGATNGVGLSAAGAGTGAGIATTGGATGAGLTATAQGGSDGLVVTGQGAGVGFRVFGGATGSGIDVSGVAGLVLNGSNGPGISTSGGTNGPGFEATGAGTGAGIRAVGASTGSGIVATGTGGGHGITATGGGAGHGILTTGGGTNGDGLRAVAGATNANGITATGAGTGSGIAGTGGSTGHGLLGTGGTNGDGIRGAGTGTGHGLNGIGGATNGNGILGTGTAAGHGLRVVGGGTNGDGISAAGGATNGRGIAATGAGSGAGVLGTGGATGAGINGTGGTNGDGIRASGTGTGHGLNATGGGTDGDGIRATGGATNSHGLNVIGQGTGDGLRADGGATGVDIRLADAGLSVATQIDVATSTRLAPTVAGRTLDVSTGGEAGVDWANVGSPATTNNLSGTTISTSQAVASVSGAVGSVTGAVGSVTGSVGGDVAGKVLGGGASSITGTGVRADVHEWLGTAVATPGTAGVPAVDVVRISDDDAAANNLETMLDGTGGNVLTLRQLNIVATGNDSAIVATGAGTGHGVLATGGGTNGAGVRAVGGATNGAGVSALGSGSGAGILGTGGASGDGIRAAGTGAGHGLNAIGGASSGDGIVGAGGSTNGRGMALTGQGSGAGLLGLGGSTGAGLRALGGTNGDGIIAAGAGSGHGINATGGTTNGDGLRAIGGSTNGRGIVAAGAGSGAGTLTTGGATAAGLRAVGGTNGDGITAAGTGTGHGLNVVGGATNGDGIRATGTTNAHGLNVVGAGTGDGLRADGGASGVDMRLADAAIDVAARLNTLQADTDDIQTRLPAALSGGRMVSVAEVVSDKTGYSIAGTKTTLDALNDLSTSQVNTEVQAVVVANHLDHLLAATYDATAKPGVADALLNELVQDDGGGITQYTANALAQGAGGGGLTQQNVRDAMKLAPTAGAPAADSIDAELDQILNEVGTLAVASAAINQPAESFTGTTVTVASGSFSDTFAVDAVYHQLQDVAGAMDVYYQFDIGLDGVPTGVTITGRLTGSNDNLTVYAWNWISSGWDGLGAYAGQPGTPDVVRSYNLLTAHVGSGANDGKVRVRFQGTGLTTANLFVDQIFVSYAVLNRSVGYEGAAIWIDTVSGTAGTTPFVHGTADRPVLTLTDAVTLAAATGLRAFRLAHGSSITLTQAFNEWVFSGARYSIALGGQQIDNTVIENATITGIATTSVATNRPKLVGCRIDSSTLPPCRLIACSWEGPVLAGAAGVYTADQCYTAADSPTPDSSFDFGVGLGNTVLNVRHQSGVLEVRNMNQSGSDTVFIEGWGQIIAAATCVGGSITVRGHFNRIDNSGGAVTWIDDARFTRSELVDDVYEETRAGHTTPGTYGEGVASVQGSVTGSVGSVVGHTPQTGDSFVRIGATGSGLTSLASASALATVDTLVQQRATPAQVQTELQTYDAPTKAELDAAVATLATAAALATAQSGITAIDGRLPADPADESNQLAQHSATQAAIAGLNNLSTAQVKAQVDAALRTDTFALPGQSTPSTTPTVVQALAWLYKGFTHETRQTATQWSLFNADGATVDAKRSVSDDGTTFTVGKIESGP